MSELPSGTVAFLFTDVEGSTKLLQAHPRAYPRAIARHHEILASAVADQGGVVFETVGDAVYASFARTEAAARAALAGQRGLAAEDWGELGALRVRMGIHTGDVELHGEHYFGPALYRCARIMAAAHGAQVLASEVTAGILRDAAPAEISLRDLGEHRLKDLQRSERLFQLAAPGLIADFPPPRTIDAHPNNLPLLATATVGRARELSETRAILLEPTTRILTLTGPGGTGKTRLALMLAADVLEEFGDGVFFVPLAPITDTEFVVPAIAGALGVRETTGRTLLEALSEHLHDRRLVLLLDNFERLLDAAPRVAELLAAAPRLVILATSQAPLRLYGEREYRVLPLATTPDGDDPDRSEAVQLFLARWREIRSDLQLTAADTRTALAICQRLDGLPLAIELAAARTRSLAPAALLDRLDRRLDLLTSGPRDAPARQRTLRATLAWSHDLLLEPERRVFRRLSVFSGGCDLAAAERVMGAPATLDLLESLVEKSLVRSDGRRFSMLETVREFAREQLDSDGQRDVVERRHAEYFAEMAQEAERHLRGAGHVEWSRRLDVERENLRAALTWSLASDPRVALLIAHGLVLYWYTGGALGEGRRWLDAVVPAGVDDDGRLSWVTSWAGFFAAEQGDGETYARRAREGLALARRSADELTLVPALVHFAMSADWNAEAALALQEATLLAARSGDPWAIGMAAMATGESQRIHGDEEAALASYERALAAFQVVGHTLMWGLNALNCGHMRLRRGDLPAAEELMLAGLRAAEETRDPIQLAYSLSGLAGVRGARGDHRGTAAILGWVDAALRRTGAVMQATDRADQERFATAARAALGDPGFERAWREGVALSREAVIELATRRDD